MRHKIIEICLVKGASSFLVDYKTLDALCMMLDVRCLMREACMLDAGWLMAHASELKAMAHVSWLESCAGGPWPAMSHEPCATSHEP